MSLSTKPSSLGLFYSQSNTARNNKNNKSIQLPLRTPNHPVNTTPTLTIKRNKITHKVKRKPTSSDVLSLVNSLSLSLPIPQDIYVSLIKECTLARDAVKAAELHSHVVSVSRTFELTTPLINRILLMYVSCGDMVTARRVFDEMTVRRDFTTWALMIVGYLECSLCNEGICLFVEMMRSACGVSGLPVWVMVCVLKACVHVSHFGLGRQVHGLLLKLGSGKDLSLGSSLINFYGKFGYLEDAEFVFDGLSRRNTVVWTAKIGNSSREGRLLEVIKAFNEMGREGIKKNSYTFSSMLGACARVEDGGGGGYDGLSCGRQIHGSAIKLGLEANGFVECGLVDMYGKCGMVQDATRVFEMVANRRNVACWNAMVIGYLQNGLHIEALKLLYQMKGSKIKVQQSLMDEVRIACGSIGSASKGKGIG